LTTASLPLAEATPEEVAERPADRRTALDRALFPAAQGARLTWRRVLLATVAVLAGAGVCLSRVRGYGPFDTLWAEDGSGFLYDALNKHPGTPLVKGVGGYMVLLPRVISEFTRIFPITWAPAVMSTGAALWTALCALGVYLASGAHLRRPLLRLLVSVPVVATSVGGLTTPDNVATLQFVALYATFWMLVWVPSTRIGRLFATAVVAVTGLSTILAVVFVPVALVRLWVRRDRWSAVLAAAVLGSAAVQLGGQAVGFYSRAGISSPRIDPLWAFVEYVVWGLPYLVLGEAWMLPDHPHPGEHVVLVVVAYAIVVAAILFAAVRFTRPAWGLVALAGLHSAGVMVLELMGMGFQYKDSYLVPDILLLGGERYLVAPTLLLIAAMAALLRPDPPAEPPGVDGATAYTVGTTRFVDRLRLPGNAWPAVAYAVLVAVLGIANLRVDSARASTLSWSALMAQAKVECQAKGVHHRVRVHNGGTAWYPWVDVPCKRLL
jgi:hypothetical protein